MNSKSRMYQYPLFVRATYGCDRVLQVLTILFPSFRLLLHASDTDRSLIETVTNADVFQNMEAYMVFGDVDVDIVGNGPYTLFAPWDPAFKRLPQPLVDKLTSRFWGAHLQNTMRFHIFNGDLSIDKLPKEETTVTMANGESLTLSKQSSRAFGVRVSVNGNVAVGQFKATNGMWAQLNKRATNVPRIS